ncbi:CDF family Co(II)/Ni(II) efflux transporter DmeF [Caballeronia sp. J97]|uniref:CDF family Co(II)/Ni(II) efflux transporter DmeF n=1 Tax=Caballeronia sp. J97 TaxID=2805429 RepID=UPI002AB29D99|nr:CDF family Co(II)/Ni(II) efflux transporter DmeF [Caballeronia sp. J97]
MKDTKNSSSDHEHSFLGESHDENARRTRSVVALTFLMMVGEIVAGYLTGSMALLADGFHMATHAGALGIAVLAYAYAKRNALNRAFSFGTGKVGELAGFASALILALVSLGICIESIFRLVTPTRVEFGNAIAIAIVGLIVNIVSAFLLSAGHGHHGHHHHEHEHHTDNNLRSAYVHVLADALTSILAIAALLAGRYLGWIWLDPVMGIVGSVVIARWAWTLMRDTADVLLDKTDEHVAHEIRDILSLHGDTELVDLHVWQIGPQALAAIVSVHTQGSVSARTVHERLRSVHEISHLTVEAV